MLYNTLINLIPMVVIKNFVIDESKEIRSVFEKKFSGKLYGKKCIIEMKEKDLNWKQMEWPGWYIEEMGRMFLIQELGGSIGPSFGRTKFDYMKDYVWDIKVHTNNNLNGHWCILNDREAIETIIQERGGIGFFISLVDVEYDQNGAFKRWHDELKEKISDYEKERIQRGASSRRRKAAIQVVPILLSSSEKINIYVIK